MEPAAVVAAGNAISLRNERRCYMANDLLRAIVFCFKTHEKYSSSPDQAVRKWDNETPYSVHALWCATTFLQETGLPNTIDRWECALALLFHDIVENTGKTLPTWLPLNVNAMVDHMTFTSEVGSTEIEKKEIWSRPPVVRLLKLYDKTSNLLDGSWMPDEKWDDQYVPYVWELADDVEKTYGKLNIVKIARAIAVRRL
jgi:hypothetical protein